MPVKRNYNTLLAIVCINFCIIDLNFNANMVLICGLDASFGNTIFHMLCGIQLNFRTRGWSLVYLLLMQGNAVNVIV